jgi:hypothetical protein
MITLTTTITLDAIAGMHNLFEVILLNLNRGFDQPTRFIYRCEVKYDPEIEESTMYQV